MKEATTTYLLGEYPIGFLTKITEKIKLGQFWCPEALVKVIRFKKIRGEKLRKIHLRKQ